MYRIKKQYYFNTNIPQNNNDITTQNSSLCQTKGVSDISQGTIENKKNQVRVKESTFEEECQTDNEVNNSKKIINEEKNSSESGTNENDGILKDGNNKRIDSNKDHQEEPVSGVPNSNDISQKPAHVSSAVQFLSPQPPQQQQQQQGRKDMECPDFSQTSGKYKIPEELKEILDGDDPIITIKSNSLLIRPNKVSVLSLKPNAQLTSIAKNNNIKLVLEKAKFEPRSTNFMNKIETNLKSIVSTELENLLYSISLNGTLVNENSEVVYKPNISIDTENGFSQKLSISVGADIEEQGKPILLIAKLVLELSVKSNDIQLKNNFDSICVNNVSPPFTRHSFVGKDNDSTLAHYSYQVPIIIFNDYMVSFMFSDYKDLSCSVISRTLNNCEGGKGQNKYTYSIKISNDNDNSGPVFAKIASIQNFDDDHDNKDENYVLNPGEYTIVEMTGKTSITSGSEVLRNLVKFLRYYNEKLSTIQNEDITALLEKLKALFSRTVYTNNIDCEHVEPKSDQFGTAEENGFVVSEQMTCVSNKGEVTNYSYNNSRMGDNFEKTNTFNLNPTNTNRTAFKNNYNQGSYSNTQQLEKNMIYSEEDGETKPRLINTSLEAIVLEPSLVDTVFNTSDTLIKRLQRETMKGSFDPNLAHNIAETHSAFPAIEFSSTFDIIQLLPQKFLTMNRGSQEDDVPPPIVHVKLFLIQRRKFQSIDKKFRLRKYTLTRSTINSSNSQYCQLVLDGGIRYVNVEDENGDKPIIITSNGTRKLTQNSESSFPLKKNEIEAYADKVISSAMASTMSVEPLLEENGEDTYNEFDSIELLLNISHNEIVLKPSKKEIILRQDDDDDFVDSEMDENISETDTYRNSWDTGKSSVKISLLMFLPPLSNTDALVNNGNDIYDVYKKKHEEYMALLNKMGNVATLEESRLKDAYIKESYSPPQLPFEDGELVLEIRAKEYGCGLESNRAEEIVELPLMFDKTVTLSLPYISDSPVNSSMKAGKSQQQFIQRVLDVPKSLIKIHSPRIITNTNESFGEIIGLMRRVISPISRELISSPSIDIYESGSSLPVLSFLPSKLRDLSTIISKGLVATSPITSAFCSRTLAAKPDTTSPVEFLCHCEEAQGLKPSSSLIIFDINTLQGIPGPENIDNKFIHHGYLNDFESGLDKLVRDLVSENIFSERIHYSNNNNKPTKVFNNHKHLEVHMLQLTGPVRDSSGNDYSPKGKYDVVVDLDGFGYLIPPEGVFCTEEESEKPRTIYSEQYHDGNTDSKMITTYSTNNPLTEEQYMVIRDKIVSCPSYYSPSSTREELSGSKPFSTSLNNNNPNIYKSQSGLYRMSSSPRASLNSENPLNNIQNSDSPKFGACFNIMCKKNSSKSAILSFISKLKAKYRSTMGQLLYEDEVSKQVLLGSSGRIYNSSYFKSQISSNSKILPELVIRSIRFETREAIVLQRWKLAYRPLRRQQPGKGIHTGTKKRSVITSSPPDYMYKSFICLGVMKLVRPISITVDSRSLWRIVATLPQQDKDKIMLSPNRNTCLMADRNNFTGKTAFAIPFDDRNMSIKHTVSSKAKGKEGAERGWMDTEYSGYESSNDLGVREGRRSKSSGLQNEELERSKLFSNAVHTYRANDPWTDAPNPYAVIDICERDERRINRMKYEGERTRILRKTRNEILGTDSNLKNLHGKQMDSTLPSKVFMNMTSKTLSQSCVVPSQTTKTKVRSLSSSKTKKATKCLEPQGRKYGIYKTYKSAFINARKILKKEKGIDIYPINMADFFLYKEQRLVGSKEIDLSNPYANAPWWVCEYTIPTEDLPKGSTKMQTNIIESNRFFDTGNPLLLLEPAFLSFPPTSISTIDMKTHTNGRYPPISLVALKITNNSPNTRVLLHFPTGRKISHTASTPASTIYNIDATRSSPSNAPVFIPFASTLVVPPASVATMPIQFVPENDGRISSLVITPKAPSEMRVFGSDYVVKQSINGSKLVPPALLVFSRIKFSISYPVSSELARDNFSKKECLLPCCGLVVPGP